MRVISLRRPDHCSRCGDALPAGMRAHWDQKAKLVVCLSCLPETTGALPEPGRAGSSAEREYRRRAARHEAAQTARLEEDARQREARRRAHPILGTVANAVIPKATADPEPAHVRSWAIGAPGEMETAAALDAIGEVRALHDRRIPGHGRANIDHVAVCPSGIWAIDTKRYVGKEVAFANAGGLFRRDERLKIGGRDMTKLVEGMGRQVAAVTEAAGSMLAGTEVRPMLCLVDAHWPLLAKPFGVRGVVVCRPGALSGLLSRPGPFDGTRRDALAAALAGALPSA